ncbi:gamma-glutamyl-gamma-aminobutyrate hydrolase family protein [Acidisoma silvae]|uniref:gamma-glutamyl-gamma-aminobutyrate hydrolase n=1 Tax=Acidisoma silvae TaxID=2802396 RepID=A0A964E029_9PROT|nr:gamma-glutamyl-gamma-aminobutyrate hydrolase family protein [Acidisoma silvae]MCB8876916.1 gamma-glutamyl-gamma-aminobutyrate hydrolase family protein [Acidisoma silvae]
MTVIIGISCCRKQFDGDDELAHAASDTYVRAVTDFIGGIPVLIPARGGAGDIERLLRLVDGLILTGSLSNVGPGYYGGPPHPPETPEDCERDGMTLPLIRAAVAAGKPLLGICRGLQELNVALGGSLHQRLHDLPSRLDHSHPLAKLEELRHAKAHSVHPVQGGWLAGISQGQAMIVNSYHNQGIDRLAPGMTVEGYASDGTVEAVRLPGESFAVGLQWHPEYDMEVNPQSRLIFETFGDVVRDAGRRTRQAERSH